MILDNDTQVENLKTITNIKDILNYCLIISTESINKKQMQDVLNNMKIDGNVIISNEKNICKNKNLGLEKLRDINGDYVLIMEPNDSINGSLKLPEKMDKDSYNLINCSSITSYIQYKPQLLKKNNTWKFIGLANDYPICINKKDITYENIYGNYYILSNITETERYKKSKDMALKLSIIISLLENNSGSTDDLNYIDKTSLLSKYIFMAGQHYYNIKDFTSAIKYYKMRLKYNDENDEIYYSGYQLGKCFDLLGKNNNVIINAYNTCYNTSKRAEPLFEISEIYKRVNDKKNALKYLIRAKDISYPKDGNYIMHHMYDWGIIYSLLLLYYDLKEYDLFLKLFEKADRMNNKVIEKIKSLKYEILIKNKDKNSEYDINLVNKINKKINSKNENQLTLTITTCKRFHLFVKTINSFINCCEDVLMIDRWICIDDNSSDDDRKKMKELYPFFEFIFKKPHEKGHVNSLEIIIGNVKTPYLLHLEDDWHFLEKREYIKPALEILNSKIIPLEPIPFDVNSKKIGQVLFNRNYMETEQIYEGGYKAKTDSDIHFLVHEYCNEQDKEYKEIIKKYKLSCVYWPHYSLRPSVLKTKVFEDVGHYTTEKKFFEMDYGYKYYEKGYISVFYNSLTCLHIGKLTITKNGHDNAYSLNDVDQFGDSKKNQEYMDYIFYPNYDSKGNDILNVANADIETLKMMADKNDKCVAFNSYGSLKYKINRVDKFTFLPTIHKYVDGLFVKKSQLITPPKFENYIFYENKDSQGNDLYHYDNLTIEELKKIADKDENCIGFNTYGYFKSEIKNEKDFCNLNNRYSNYICDGLYVKKIETRDKILENYTFYRNKDSYFNDLYQHNNKTIDELKKIADEDDSCVAFNTYGYFKSKICEIAKLKQLDTRNKRIFYDGIYVKNGRDALLSFLDENYEESLKKCPKLKNDIYNLRYKNLLKLRCKYEKYNKNNIDTIKNNGDTTLIMLLNNYDDFCKSINTFINRNKNNSEIKKWLCVCENRDITNEENIKEQYPFFDFIYISSIPEDIKYIYVLKTIKHFIDTTYVLIIEDNWRFIEPEDYINESLNIFKKNKKIGQVIFDTTTDFCFSTPSLINIKIFDKEYICETLGSKNVINTENYDENEENLLSDENFTYYPGKDSMGSDIYCEFEKNINKLKKIALNNDNCIAFNTYGYLKHKIVPTNKFFNFKDKNHGIFVRKTKNTYQQPLKFRNYHFYPNKDIISNDIFRTIDNNLLKTKKMCDKNYKTIGFNTYGLVKINGDKNDFHHIWNLKNEYNLQIGGFYMKKQNKINTDHITVKPIVDNNRSSLEFIKNIKNSPRNTIRFVNYDDADYVLIVISSIDKVNIDNIIKLGTTQHNKYDPNKIIIYNYDNKLFDNINYDFLEIINSDSPFDSNNIQQIEKIISIHNVSSTETQKLNNFFDKIIIKINSENSEINNKRNISFLEETLKSNFIDNFEYTYSNDIIKMAQKKDYKRILIIHDKIFLDKYKIKKINLSIDFLRQKNIEFGTLYFSEDKINSDKLINRNIYETKSIRNSLCYGININNPNGKKYIIYPKLEINKFYYDTDYINKDTKYKIICVNLERRPDRKKNMVHEFETNNIGNYEFYKAIDGKKINPDDYIKKLFKGNDFGSRTSFIGCALSHYNLWKQLIDDQENDYYVIMEDDIKFKKDFKKKFDYTIEYVNNNMKKWDILFFCLLLYNYGDYRNDSENIIIEKSVYNFSVGGLAAYIINKSGAIKLCDYINKNGIKHGIDYIVVKLCDDKTLLHLQTTPFIVYVDMCNDFNSSVDTDIQKDIRTIDID